VTQQILRVADETRCDLIVLGTHNREEFDHTLLGSVAESVLQQASCPVLVAKVPRRETSRFTPVPSRPAVDASNPDVKTPPASRKTRGRKQTGRSLTE
jgi:hypothetical protein